MVPSSPTEKLYSSFKDTFWPTKRKKKFKTMEEVMNKAKYIVIERDSYSDVLCDECGSGERPEELLLCDKCDKGFHMGCVRPIVVRIPIGSWVCPNCLGQPCVTSFSQKKITDFFKIHKPEDGIHRCTRQEFKRRRRRSGKLVCYKKKKRRFLPYVPSDDPTRRLEQMRSLAEALTAHGMEFSNELTYMHAMAPRSANVAKLEIGGIQVLSKEDYETVEQCRAMARRGEYPPLVIVFDSREGYTIKADDPIKDMTFLAEYTGDVDYIKNRENDDCDSLMTLLLTQDPSQSLVICPHKRGNIARFISGINNHAPKSKRKQNVKCVRYDMNGESHVLLVSNRDIAKGERLYIDYNGYEYQYPTHHFV